MGVTAVRNTAVKAMPMEITIAKTTAPKAATAAVTPATKSATATAVPSRPCYGVKPHRYDANY